MFDHLTARLAGGTGSARTATHRREQAQIDDGVDVIGMFDHLTARLAGGTGSARTATTHRGNRHRSTMALTSLVCSIISPLASPEAPARLALPLTGGNRHRSTMALTSLVCSIISPLASPEAPARLALPLTGGNRHRST